MPPFDMRPITFAVQALRYLHFSDGPLESDLSSQN